MQDSPLSHVDVIIVNYRSYDELNRCLAGLDQCHDDLGRVVVIDHDSDPQAAAYTVAQFPWAQIVERSTNEGFATGVNLGAQRCDGAYLLLLNPDCVPEASAIRRLVQYAASRADAAVIGPCILNADGSVQGSARRFPGLTTFIAGRSSWLTRRFPRNPLSRHNLPALDRRTTPLEVDWVSGACMLVRRAAFNQVGGMDEDFFLYWEDADLCYRLGNVGWRTLYLPSAVVVHAGGRSSIHAYRESLIAFHKSAYILFRKRAHGATKFLQPVVFLVLRLRLAVLLLIHRKRLTKYRWDSSRTRVEQSIDPDV